MIFQRALIREFSGLAIAVFATLFAITLTTQLIRLLGQAATGRVLSEGVLALLGFSALNYLPVLLSLTLFVSVLMALSRGYRDSEMVVWFSSGQPLTAWIRPVLVFATPIVLLIGALSFFLSPWAVGKSEEYRRQMENRDDLARVAPGVFREASGTDRVFFVEQVPGEEAKVRNVFVAQLEKGILSVLVSQQGFTETASNGDRSIVLLNGRRYDGTPGMPGYRMMDFERYALKVEAREMTRPQSSAKAMSTWLLAQSPGNSHRAELLWRIGLPLSALNLCLLAIPLSFVNPRASRSVNLIFALLAYMFYSNLVSIAQAWVSQGRLSFATGWWAVHALMFALLLLLFWNRLRVSPFIRILR
ncbi:MAG: LPS export ABC transporter permease LptF [Betaproteobacteria bacterium RIFCSPLOWO2_02_FULL_65_24]|nr:MAG: LPS export ABC transporter permease LptF [Betaproteobacteria bacterium RIFCSPLOWO2_02_FULL_65_24]OGA36621.1 MAG: LPS export ABC transporter permease LptF [Betaproteobacteria bacterium RIFCSPLOWO2_12_FULL_62_13b]